MPRVWPATSSPRSVSGIGTAVRVSLAAPMMAPLAGIRLFDQGWRQAFGQRVEAAAHLRTAGSACPRAKIAR